jgi:CRP-like cAMP-binding protein
MSTTTIRRIAGHELFGGCRRSELARIDQLGTTLSIPPGRALCEEGEPGLEFFVLLEGSVMVRTAAGTVALLRPGAWFGEAALLDGKPRRATVTTTTHVTVIVFEKREFHCLLAVAPCVGARVRRAANQIVNGYAPTRQPWYQPLPAGFPLMNFGSS